MSNGELLKLRGNKNFDPKPDLDNANVGIADTVLNGMRLYLAHPALFLKGEKMNQSKKLALSGLLIALCVAASPFYIPIGASKCFPVQAIVNIISGVLLGPFYAVGIAFSASTLRIFMGTGSLLAYPGSMIGAFLCGMLYKKTKWLPMAFIGETVGTGILGAMAAYPIVSFILSKQAALFTYVIPFMISSAVGSGIAVFIVMGLMRVKLFKVK